MKPTKRPWTRQEKWLWVAPLLFVVAAGAALWGPDVVRKGLGRPTLIPVTSSGAMVYWLALSSDGEILATANGDSNISKSPGAQIFFWNTKTLRPVPLAGGAVNRGLKPGHTNVAFDLAPDGKSVVYARSDYRLNLGARGRESPLQLFDLIAGRTLWQLPPSFWVGCARFSPDGQTVGVLRRWNHKPQSEFYALRASDGAILSHWMVADFQLGWGEFRWMPDGKAVAIARSQRQSKAQSSKATPRQFLELRGVQNGAVMRSWPTPAPLDVVPWPDGSSLLSLTSDVNATSQFAATKVNATTGQQQWRYKADGNCRGAVAPNGKRVAVFVAGDSPHIELLDSATGVSVRTLRVPSAQVNGNVLHVCLWSPDSKRLYARGKSAVLVWDLD